MSEAYTSELERQVQELKLLLKQRNDKIAEQAGRNLELEAQISSMKEKLKDLENQTKQSEQDAEELREMRTEMNKLQRENSALSNSIAEKDASLVDVQPKIRKLQGFIDDLRDELRKEMDRNKFMHQCVRRANECEALVKKWEVEIKGKDDEIEQLKNRVAEQRRQLLNEKLANRRLQDELDCSGGLQERCEKLQKENTAMAESLEKLGKKAARQKSMLSDAHRMMHAFFENKSEASAQSSTSRSTNKSDCEFGGVEHLKSNLTKAQRERLCALCIKRGDHVRANNGKFSFIATVRYVDRVFNAKTTKKGEQDRSATILVGLRFVSLYPPKRGNSALTVSSAHFPSEADVWNSAADNPNGYDDTFAGLCLGLAFPITQIEAVHVDKSHQFVPLRRLTNSFLNATHNGTFN